jgi:hypothetical protein
MACKKAPRPDVAEQGFTEVRYMPLGDGTGDPSNVFLATEEDNECYAVCYPLACIDR